MQCWTDVLYSSFSPFNDNLEFTVFSPLSAAQSEAGVVHIRRPSRIVPSTAPYFHPPYPRIRTQMPASRYAGELTSPPTKIRTRVFNDSPLRCRAASVRHTRCSQWCTRSLDSLPQMNIDTGEPSVDYQSISWDDSHLPLMLALLTVSAVGPLIVNDKEQGTARVGRLRRKPRRRSQDQGSQTNYPTCQE